jgi:hypothetical protein
VIELLVRAPWRAIEPREAVLFWKIAVEKPTLLLDEVDVMFAKDRKGDAQAALRGIINAGNQRGASIPPRRRLRSEADGLPDLLPEDAGRYRARASCHGDRPLDQDSDVPRTKAERGERGTSIETSILLLMSFARDCPSP